MEHTIDLLSYIKQFNYSRRLLVNRLKKDSVTRINIWGTGLSGEAVTNLLQSSGIEIGNYYDSYKEGIFLGRTVINPYKGIQRDVPVIVASAREPKDLEAITGFLASQKITYYLINISHKSRLNLVQFIDRHKGSRCFVIGNGPSLNRLNMSKLRSEITFGANRCFLGFEKWGFSTKYWALEDKLVAEDVQDQWNDFSGPVKFIPADLQHLVTNYQNLCLVNFTREQFEKRGEMPRFSSHPAELFWGGTVTYLMIQLAVIMGCNPIYLIGVDFHYIKPIHVTVGENRTEWTSHGDDPNHFHPDYFGNNRKWHDPMVSRMKKAYIAAKSYADHNNLEILNATPGTKLDVFTKVDFNTLV